MNTQFLIFIVILVAIWYFYPKYVFVIPGLVGIPLMTLPDTQLTTIMSDFPSTVSAPIIGNKLVIGGALTVLSYYLYKKGSPLKFKMPNFKTSQQVSTSPPPSS